LALYLDRFEDGGAVLARIEAGALATITMTGDGSFHWTRYENATSKRTFYDRDYLAFSVGKSLEDVARVLRLTFSGGNETPDVIVRTFPAALPRYVVWDTFVVDTYLRPLAQVLDVADQYAKLLTASPREVRFTARGKLADLSVADIITINRTRGLDPSGALVNVKFRIVRLDHNDAAGISACVGVEYVSLS